ncbi:winged helix-turn-helix transcriptional regulator [Sphingobacteriaceae bacterium WQ 2009]|uniref:Winged helix-turn-helix transcriptional regulator n=1 Tax=Rhinopithecimicrobium faecis TaxID=2820698 RepID=A0A8T4HBP5_9SPHI|nr:winged helix-turn-helix transcriptional regulator [Sphingobacteriaceae bacterium WQ 2009]
MGTTKSYFFSNEINHLSNLFRALGHPARIAIVQHLIDQKTCICNDLVEELGLAQATISQHLKALKDAGIIKGNIEGKSICYCIDENNWAHMEAHFHAFIGQKVQANSCC